MYAVLLKPAGVQEHKSTSTARGTSELLLKPAGARGLQAPLAAQVSYYQNLQENKEHK